MIHLDTSFLIDALSGPRRRASDLRRTIADGERLSMSTLVLYEWQRGPRHPAELRALELLVPPDRMVAFGAREATRAAGLYRALKRARGREIDLAIAACALTHDAALWTLNPEDFRDIPDLRLYEPGRG